MTGSRLVSSRWNEVNGLEPERRKLIIREIREWRSSRLLPEQYCDFLLNLYQDDPEDRNDRGWHGLSPAAIRKGSLRSWLSFFGTVGIICLIAFNFNSFPLPLQIAAVSFFVIVCYGFGIRLRNRLPVLSCICMGAASLLLLAGGVNLLGSAGAAETVLSAYVAACAVIWMVAGLSARLPLFHFAGWILLLVIYASMLNRYLLHPDWIELEMAWIPGGILLIWVGWLLHRHHRSAASVLLAVGALIWFIPEVYGYVNSDFPKEALQLLWLGKWAAAAIILYMFRKKWTDWIV